MEFVTASVGIGFSAAFGFLQSGNIFTPPSLTRRYVLTLVTDVIISLIVAGVSFAFTGQFQIICTPYFGRRTS